MALTKIDDRGLNTPVNLLDNEKIRFGTGNDLEVFHNGTDSFVKNTTGQLCLNSDEFGVANAAYTENIIRGTVNSDVELYYDNVKKFYTTSEGALVSGALGITGQNLTHGTNTLKIGHEGSGVHQIRAYGPDSSTNGQIQFRSSRGDGSNSKDIVYSSGNLEFPDSQQIRLGTGNDLSIYHDASNSYIENTTGNLIVKDTTGTIYLQSTRIDFESEDGEQIAHFISDGAVELYHNNVKKFETTSGGATVTGNLSATSNLLLADSVKARFGTGEDLQIYHDGSGSYIDNTTGTLRIRDDSEVRICHTNNETYFAGSANGSSKLYYDDSVKLETASYGIYVSGTSKGDNFGVNDNGKYYAGTGDDLQIYHTSNHSYIRNTTGDLYIQGNNSGTVTNNVICQDSGATELHYDSTKKLDTRSWGVQIEGGLILNTDSEKLYLGAGNDLQIYHNGTNSLVENGTGELLLRAKAGENSINCNPDGSVELYYNNEKVLQTEGDGASIWNTDGDAVLKITASEANAARILMQADDGDDDVDKWNLIGHEDGYFALQSFSGGGWTSHIYVEPNGKTALSYHNSMKLRTETDGVRIIGDSKLWMDPWQGRLDRNWDDYPSITISPSETYGASGKQSEFRLHGQSGALSGYGSGADFSIDMRVDGSYETGSDRRRKSNIEEITGALATVKQLTGKKFNIINRQGDLDPNKGTKKQFGLIAQECKDIIPEVVNFHPDEDTPNENGWCSAYGLDYGQLTPLLINAIKELSAKVEALETEVAALKG